MPVTLMPVTMRAGQIITGFGVMRYNQPASLVVEWVSSQADKGSIPQQVYDIFPGGLADAQFGFATMLDNGHGVAEDHAAAEIWYRKAAENGHSGAQLGLGFIFREGLGVRPDHSESRRWYLKAADNDDTARAALNLGHLYRFGLGTGQNYSQAVRWYLAAAKHESEADDDDIPFVWQAQKSLREIAAPVQQLAGRGDADAQFALSLMYEAGAGVGPDKTEALRWRNLAAGNGYVIGLRQNFTATMPPGSFRPTRVDFAGAPTPS